jgi:hypothetical protein
MCPPSQGPQSTSHHCFSPWTCVSTPPSAFLSLVKSSHLILEYPRNLKSLEGETDVASGI